MTVDPTQLAAGSRLGRFEILARLGAGTSGTVYLAQDTALEDRVALKILNADVKEIAEQRFKREILLARRISHPGICRVFDLHEEGEMLFLTMEHIPGDTLELVLTREGSLEINRSVRILRDVCDAVSAAHGAGILHRDLKPANIILGLGRKPTVLDFGCATAPQLERVTRIGYVVGTARYVAPEILNGQAGSSEATDVYSLGVVLFRCLTGQFPYVANTVQELRDRSLKPPSPPSRHKPEIGPALDAVVQRVLSPDPAQRFSSAADFQAALAHAAEDTAPKIVARIAEPDSPWDGDIERTVTNVVNLLVDSDVFAREVTYTTALFCDIVGITEFFRAFGGPAGRRRIEIYRDLVLEQVRACGGTTIETSGDAIVASFPSAHDGVNAAIDIQRVLAAHNSKAAKGDDPISVRIGVNSGEAISEGSKLFGEALNVAARVAGRAHREQILVTQRARDALVHSDIPVVLHTSALLPGCGPEPFDLFRVVWNRRGSARQGTTDEIATSVIEDTTDEIPPTKVPSAATVIVAARPGHDTPASLAEAPPAVPMAQIEAKAAPQPARPEARSKVISGVGQWGLRSGRAAAPPGQAPAPPPARPPSATSGARRGSGEVTPGMSFTARAQAARAAHSRAAAAKAPRAEKVDWRDRCDELITELEPALIDKGIVRGDDEAIDKLMDTAVRQADQDQHEQAVRFLELAHARVSETAIDLVFVNAKLGRLERMLQRCDSVLTAEIAPLLADARRQAGARQFAAANDALNRAFGALGTG